MSIFDFLFARAATPEQRNKNIFLDAIDGGGRFASFRDVADDDPNKFRGGPLGISALLNALGVDPYGYTDAQPSSPPPRTAPVAKPARQSAPRPAATPNLVDFIAANTGLRPSTDAELTDAFDQPTPPSLIGRPFDGAGFGYTAPPPALPPTPSYDAERMMRINEIPVAAPLNLLNPQVEAAMRDSETNYFDTAVKYPDFFPFVQANSSSGLSTEQLARQFLKIPEGTASPLAMSAAPAALSSSPIGTSGSLPVLSNDFPTNTIPPSNTASFQQYSMPRVPNDAPTSDNPNRHPESEIQRFMRDHDMTRETAIISLDASVQYEREVREALRNALQGN